jgi:hypothetical protein
MTTVAAGLVPALDSEELRHLANMMLAVKDSIQGAHRTLSAFKATCRLRPPDVELIG